MNRLSICGETHTFDEFGRCVKCNCPDFEKHTNLSLIVEKLINGEQVQGEENNSENKKSRVTPVIIGCAAAGVVDATATAIAIKKRKRKTEE